MKHIFFGCLAFLSIGAPSQGSAEGEIPLPTSPEYYAYQCAAEIYQAGDIRKSNGTDYLYFFEQVFVLHERNTGFLNTFELPQKNWRPMRRSIASTGDKEAVQEIATTYPLAGHFVALDWSIDMRVVTLRANVNLSFTPRAEGAAAFGFADAGSRILGARVIAQANDRRHHLDFSVECSRTR